MFEILVFNEVLCTFLIGSGSEFKFDTVDFQSKKKKKKFGTA